MATQSDNSTTPKEITNNELGALILNLEKKLSNKIDDSIAEFADKVNSQFNRIDARFEAMEKANNERFDGVDESIEAVANKSTVIQKNIFELDQRFVTRSEYVSGALTFRLQR